MSEPRPRILVVDDEMGPRESLRMILKPRYDIATADSGEAALKALPEASARTSSSWTSRCRRWTASSSSGASRPSTPASRS